ncbi:MAG: sugar phosphate nucleotidyltransferase [Vulcanimicrobiota bacterium]
MKAIVLVGGKGTRLRPLTYDFPKPMMPICGKPFIEYQLQQMKDFGISDVIFSLGYKWKTFDYHFGDGKDFGIKLHYVVEDSPLGTGGAIKNIQKLLNSGENFFVFNGDILAPFDLKAIYDLHTRNKSVCTLALTPVEDPTAYGVVETDKNNRITSFTEKPRPEEVRSNLINAGLYVLNRRVLDYMKPDKKISIERETFPSLLQANEPMYGYSHDGYWMDIGTPEKLLQANYDVLEERMKLKTENPRTGLIPESVQIGENGKIVEPVLLGENVLIGKNVKITGPAVIEKDSKIGDNCVIDRSLIWEGAHIGNNCVLNQNIVGRFTQLHHDVSLPKKTVLGKNEIVKPGEKIKV